MALKDIVVGETPEQYKAKMNEIAKFKGAINDLKLKYTDNEENRNKIAPDDITKLNVVLDDLLSYLNKVDNQKLPEVTKRYNETMFSFNNLVNTLDVRRFIYNNFIKDWIEDFEKTKKNIYEQAATAGKEPQFDEDQMNNMNKLTKNFKKNILDIKPYITTDQLQLEFEKFKTQFYNIIQKKVIEIEEENNKSAWDIFVEGSGTFISTVILCLYLSVGIIAGKFVANDFIERPIPYRILYFIYGAVFFFLVFPYYAYRWYKGTMPKIYSTLPIITTQYEGIIGFLLSWMIYIPDEKIAKNYEIFKQLQQSVA